MTFPVTIQCCARAESGAKYGVAESCRLMTGELIPHTMHCLFRNYNDTPRAHTHTNTIVCARCCAPADAHKGNCQWFFRSRLCRQPTNQRTVLGMSLCPRSCSCQGWGFICPLCNAVQMEERTHTCGIRGTNCTPPLSKSAANKFCSVSSLDIYWAKTFCKTLLWKLTEERSLNWGLNTKTPSVWLN